MNKEDIMIIMAHALASHHGTNLNKDLLVTEARLRADAIYEAFLNLSAPPANEEKSDGDSSSDFPPVNGET